MIETLHVVLTNADTRKKDAVKKQLSKNISAGTPWFNEL
jgi:hypothetical protein